MTSQTTYPQNKKEIEIQIGDRVCFFLLCCGNILVLQTYLLNTLNGSFPKAAALPAIKS